MNTQETKKKIRTAGAAAALLSVEMILIILLFFLSLYGFIYLVRRVFYLENTELDHRVFAYLANHVSETNNELMLFFSFIGSHNFLIPANLLLIFYFLFIRKHKWYSIKVPAIALSSLGLMFFLKGYFGRPRPLPPLLEEAAGLSFPSGHALNAVTFYGLLIYLLWKVIKNPAIKWAAGILLVLVILAIGFSRIYLRVHYTTDVIAGLCVGLIWLVLSLLLLKRIEVFSSKSPDPGGEASGEKKEHR